MRRMIVRLLIGAVLSVAASPLFVSMPVQATTLFGLVDTGELFASDDMGVTWEVLATLPVRDAIGIAAGTTSSELYLVCRSGVVYRSIDAGGTWAAVGSVAASDVVSLAVLCDGSVLLLTESGSVYVSTDQGAGFTAQAALTGYNFVSLAIRSPSDHYALTETGEVFESVDSGVNWVTKGVITVSDAVNLCVGDETLFVLTGSGDIYRNEDAGETWTPVGTLSQVHMSGFASDEVNLIAATREGEVAVSSDGITWDWQGAIGQLSVMALGTDIPPLTGVDRPWAGRVFSLGQNYPNPFNARIAVTYIPFDLVRPGSVTLHIYDARGRQVRRLLDGELRAESHSIPWRGLDDGGRPLPAGVYWFELKSGGQATHRKMILTR